MTSSEFRRIRRGILDISQSDLAKKLGVSERTITAIENSDRDVEARYELALRYLASDANQTI